MPRWGCLWFLIVFSASGGESSQQVALPAKQELRLRSPDGRWLLIASPFRERDHYTLELQEVRTAQRISVKEYDRSLSVAWSPDSKAFYLNDAYGSSVESAAVYWVETRRMLVLDEVILSHDADARMAAADHGYFHAFRWEGARDLAMEYCGHNSVGPAQQFDFIYRVGLGDGDRGGSVATVKRTFRHVGPLSLPPREYKH